MICFRNSKLIIFCCAVMLSALCVTPLAAEWRSKADENWKVIDLQDLSIKPGTALDFSFLVEKGDAGQYGFLKINNKGQFVFEQRPDVPVRMFCAPQITSKGDIPFGSVDALAEQIRLAGYNAVRAHFLDQVLMAGSKTDGVFNPENVDRWERYTAALKKRGIYLVIDASSSWAAFSTLMSWDKGSEDYRMKTRLYYDDKAREIWMKCVKQLFEHVNPYTGKALKDEPQVAWVSLRNEPGLNFLMPGKRFYDPGMVKPYRAWLKKRYSDRSAWAAAWGSALGANVTFDNVELPPMKEKGPVGADLQRFFADIEQETYFWGANFLRSIGVKVPVVDYNNGASMESIIARDVMPFVDNHVYHDHPSSYISSGSKMTCDNSLERQIGDFRWIIPTKMLGRPFTFSEWGGVFWNPYRHHDGITFASYAAFQDWQLIAQHATPVWPSLGNIGEKGTLIVPFHVAKDPPSKANERIIAFVFARGDVKSSPHQVELQLDARTIFSKFNAADTVSYSITPLALLTGFGSRVVGGKDSAPTAPYTPELVITPDGSTAIQTVDGAELTAAKGAGKDTESLVKKLRAKGVLDNNNRTDIGKNIFESDTKELYLEAGKKRFALNTPLSQGVCLPNGPSAMATGEIEVDNQGACMTLFLTSLSTEPIAKSNRLLLIVSGDALNSDMVFKDESRKVLVNIGKGPVIVRILDVKLRARLSQPDEWELWALAQNGTRVEKLPLEVKDGKVSATLKTGTLKNGPTAYFEFVRAGK